MRLAFSHQRNIIQPEPGVFQDSVQSLSSALDKKEKRLIVALHRTKLMGCIFCGQDRVKPDEALYFGRLAVHPRYQNNGIATQLVDEVERIAKAEGFKEVTCAVRIALRKNIDFFEKLGYAIVGEGTHAGFEQPTYYQLSKTI